MCTLRRASVGRYPDATHIERKDILTAQIRFMIHGNCVLVVYPVRSLCASVIPTRIPFLVKRRSRTSDRKLCSVLVPLLFLVIRDDHAHSESIPSPGDLAEPKPITTPVISQDVPVPPNGQTSDVSH